MQKVSERERRVLTALASLPSGKAHVMRTVQYPNALVSLSERKMVNVIVQITEAGRAALAKEGP